ncbi:hypothetical protein MMUR_00040 [Mycolicibacterium murale]|uniref:DUF3618 domain-containing protein n=1 Tax=Mycolicibacterium murale TaxID=182220 RepID=A0A7I9WEX1_9MYCO|nr:DUF3618 domain-containing protein [Mycolicibacterium murale]MCV7180563.1 DUF3618 domain-containing protein [Mycolicibacterium murale]GFG55868.1 hypothetical protein MMUR_00040 [Mycolicibacterium murale]
MATEQPAPGPSGGPVPDASAKDIQADIEKTRRELGHTVEALAAKADLKGQAQRKAAEAKTRLTDTAVHTKEVIVEKASVVQTATQEALTDDTGAVKPTVPVAAIVAAGLLLVGILVWRRRG